MQTELPNKLQVSGVNRWNVYEASKNYNRVGNEEEWGEWVMLGSHKTEEAAARQIEIREAHNHSTNSRNDYGIVHVRWEKRHELMLPANSKVTQNASSNEPPDYELARDRTLKKLKIGRQSAAGKAIDLFLKEVRSQESKVK